MKISKITLHSHFVIRRKAHKCNPTVQYHEYIMFLYMFYYGAYSTECQSIISPDGCMVFANIYGTHKKTRQEQRIGFIHCNKKSMKRKYCIIKYRTYVWLLSSLNRFQLNPIVMCTQFLFLLLIFIIFYSKLSGSKSFKAENFFGFE